MDRPLLMEENIPGFDFGSHHVGSIPLLETIGFHPNGRSLNLSRDEYKVNTNRSKKVLVDSILGNEKALSKQRLWRACPFC